MSVLALIACEGRIGPPHIDTTTPDHPTEPGGPVPSPFKCDAQQVQQDLPLRRLSHSEYVNTLHAFLVAAAPSSAGAIEQSLAADLAQVPDDTIVQLLGEHHGGFSRMDQTVQQANIDSTYAIAVDV